MTTNKRGRPRLDPTDRSVGVLVKMPGRTFDRVYQLAKAARLSVPEVIRRVITSEKLDIQNH